MSSHAGPDPWARRIDALLAKASSTEYPEEAEALLAKAQALMARHAIDEATLRLASARRTDEVIRRIVVVEPPYARARAMLLNGVAASNHSRLVLAPRSRPSSGGEECWLFGHPGDLDRVEMLHAALSLHATRVMLATPTNDRPRRFRHAFLLAFAVRISERLQAAVTEVQGERVREEGRSVALAVRTTDAMVDDAVERDCPTLVRATVGSSSRDGFRSGRAAADAADLGQPTLQGRRALPST